MSTGRMLSIFACGFIGSLSVELVLLLQHFQDDMPLPRRYSRAGFWVVRVGLAVIAGGLALAYDIDKPVLALHLGAAAPLIIKAFSEGAREPLPHGARTPQSGSAAKATENQI